MQLIVIIQDIWEYERSLHFGIAVESWGTLVYIPITDGTWNFRSNWVKLLVDLIQTQIQTMAGQCRSENVLCWKRLTNAMQNDVSKTPQDFRGNCNLPAQQTGFGESLLLHYLAELLPDRSPKKKKKKSDQPWHGHRVSLSACLGPVDQSLWLVWHLVTALGETSWWDTSGWRRQTVAGPWPVLPRHQSLREKPESPVVNLDSASSPA